MRKQLQTSMIVVMTLVFLFMGTQLSQAQYVPGAGFDLAWSLDPRADTNLFPRGPAFGARSVLTGMDLDGDGNKEFLFTTDETLAPSGPDPGFLDVFLYENTGDDTYEYVWHYTHTEGSNSLPALAYADIDDDGLWEIYLGIPTINDGNDLFIFEQDGSGVFPDMPTTTYGYNRDAAADFRPSGLQIVDVDGDGQKELITTSRTGSNRELVVAAPVGGINTFTTFNIEFEVGEAVIGGGGIYDVDVVDYDGDGLLEIWVNTWNNWSLTIFEATGADTYVQQVDLDGFDDDGDPGSFNSHKMLWWDVEDDGDLESFWPQTNGVLYYLDNISDVSTITADDFNRVGRYASTARGGDIGDVDGDGMFDIIAAGSTDEIVARMEYDGVGDPADSTSYEWSVILDSDGGAGDRYYPLRIADDLDQDGQNEVVLTNLFASSDGQPIIIILEASGAVSVDQPSEIGGYVLSQNYPNPFSGTSTVSFEIPSPSEVRLEVFDIMGRRVSVLAEGSFPSGTHEATFASENLPNGVYLMRLQTPAGTLVRSATVID